MYIFTRVGLAFTSINDFDMSLLYPEYSNIYLRFLAKNEGRTVLRFL